ncbi:MAG: hypothetical protein IPI49_19300 [Myxococcales bacterium]|nr:hypothetical protein [Myxococcales bacterium]
MQAGDLRTAKARFEQSLGIRQKLAQQNPTSDDAQRDLSLSLFKLGSLAGLTGDLPAAKARLEECVSILKMLAERGTITPSDREILDQVEITLQSPP